MPILVVALVTFAVLMTALEVASLILISDLKEVLQMFKDDALTKLSDQSAAIDALAARIPTDDTVVPLVDQATVLDGIQANTDKINATKPAPTV
jgi:hypothetical protein